MGDGLGWLEIGIDAFLGSKRGRGGRGRPARAGNLVNDASNLALGGIPTKLR